MQLPENTIIFCLIDSLSASENSDRRQDTTYLMKRLVRLVKTSNWMALMPPAHHDEAVVIKVVALKVKQRTQPEKNSSQSAQ